MSGMIGPLKMITPIELKEVNQLMKERRADYFISGYVFFISQHLVLFRGDESCIVVPFDVFSTSGNYSPNFNDFQIIDYGQTIKLGQYEVLSDYVLQKIDPNYVKYQESNVICQ